MVPKPLVYAAFVLGALAIVPFAFVYRARATQSTEPRIHPIQDMDNQPKFITQSANPLFADGRSMRPHVPGTLARGDLELDDHLYRGRRGADWAAGIPMPVDEALLKRGQERFNIFCATCHGASGYGDGPVARRALELGGKWVPPTSFHTDAVRQRPDGHIFNTITHGIRTMPSYGSQVPVKDRWAIIAYLRALERSQNATMNDVPPERRASLAR